MPRKPNNKDEPKNKGGRPSKYDQSKNDIVYKFCLLGATDAQIADMLCVDEATVNRWKISEPEFCKSLKRGKEEADFNVVNSLYKKANGYSYEEVVKERISLNGAQTERHGKDVELSEEQWLIALAFFENSCAYCGDGEKQITKDHVVPFKNGGKLSIDNTLPCCTSCNSSKKDRDMITWFKTKDFYNEEKEKKIKQYLSFAKNISNNSEAELKTTKVIKKEVPPDTTAAIFWLKNRQPRQWRDKQEIDHSGNLQTVINIIPASKVKDNG